MPTPEQVVSRARSASEKDVYWGVGYCLKFARTCAGAPANTYDAATAWRQAKDRHTSLPPKGYPVFWTGGSRGHGHVAISDGNGYCWSTDIKRPGRVDRVSLAYLAARWGNLNLVGWASDINSVQIGEATVESNVVAVHLTDLQPGKSSTAIKEFQLALRRHGYGSLNPSGVTGFYGDETTAMCQAFQRKQGWGGEDADGIPGPKTCALLGLHVL